MDEYISLIRAYERRLTSNIPGLFDLGRKLQRAAFMDEAGAPCHHSDTFTPAPIYLAQAEAILTGKVSLSDEVAAGSIVSAPTIEAAVAAARRGEA